MNGFLKTVIGGAIGMAALYAVGKMAYSMGKEVAGAEQHLADLKKQAEAQAEAQTERDGTEGLPMDEKQAGYIYVKKDDTGKTPISRWTLLKNSMGLFRKKDSLLRDMIRHPEAHRLEAFTDSKGLHVNVVPG